VALLYDVIDRQVAPPVHEVWCVSRDNSTEGVASGAVGGTGWVVQLEGSVLVLAEAEAELVAVGVRFVARGIAVGTVVGPVVGTAVAAVAEGGQTLLQSSKVLSASKCTRKPGSLQ